MKVRPDPVKPAGASRRRLLGESAGVRRRILTNRAWTEYLIDQATNEGMPENGRPSYLAEARQALLALERKAAGRAASGARKAA